MSQFNHTRVLDIATQTSSFSHTLKLSVTASVTAPWGREIMLY